MENLHKLFNKIQVQWRKEFHEYTQDCVNLGRENVMGCLPNNSNCVHKTRHLVRLFYKHCQQEVATREAGFFDLWSIPAPDFENCSLKELHFFLRIGFPYISKETYRFNMDLKAFVKRMMSEDCYCPHCKPKCWKR